MTFPLPAAWAAAPPRSLPGSRSPTPSAAELESHVDNLGAALLGQLVVSLVRADGSVIALRKKWPAEIRIVAVTPEISLKTNASRAALPQTVPHADAVFNEQRSALFIAALDAGRYDL